MLDAVKMTRRSVLALPALSLLAQHQVAAQSGAQLVFTTYVVMKDVGETLIPAFQQTADGAGVEIELSLSASGEQLRALQSGTPSDVVALATGAEFAKLVAAGIIPETWNQDDYLGILANTVVTFIVRKGNPKGIKTWDDLLRPDVSILFANPVTAGGGRWCVLAAYGSPAHAGQERGGRQRVPARDVPQRLHPAV